MDYSALGIQHRQQYIDTKQKQPTKVDTNKQKSSNKQKQTATITHARTHTHTRAAATLANSSCLEGGQDVKHEDEQQTVKPL